MSTSHVMVTARYSSQQGLPGPTNQEHWKLIGVKTISSGTTYYSFYCLELCAASISESEFQAKEKTACDVLPIQQSPQK